MRRPTGRRAEYSAARDRCKDEEAVVGESPWSLRRRRDGQDDESPVELLIVTEPSPDTSKRSLTMQRIALNRARAFAVAAIVFGVVWTLLAAALVFTSGNVAIHVGQLVLGIGFLVTGYLRLRNARQELRRFEEENGPGAGDQKPVR